MEKELILEMVANAKYGTNFMALEKDVEHFLSAVRKLGLKVNHHFKERVTIRRPLPSKGELFKSIVNFFIPKNGEIFIYSPPKRRFVLYSDNVSRCELLFNYKEADAAATANPGNFFYVQIFTIIGPR